MLRFCCGVLLLVCFAVGDRVVNINDGVDKALDLRNAFFTKHHMGLVPNVPLVLPNVTLSHGVAVGLNSQYRTKDCTLKISSDNKTVSVDLHFGQRLLALAYGSIKSGDVDFSGVITVHNNSAQLAYTVQVAPRCSVSVTSYKIEALQDVKLASSLRVEALDVSEYFDKTVRPFLNNIISKVKGRVEQALERIICHHRTPIHDHLPELFTTLDKINSFYQQ